MLTRLAGCVLAAYVSAVAVAAQPAPQSIHLSAKTQRNAVKPGAKFIVEILAVIDTGWHLYSTEQEAGGPRPTRFKVAPGQPFELAGSVEESGARVEFDPVLNREVQLFENEANFQVPLRVAKEAKTGKQRATINVTFQACSKQICLPPKTVPVSADLTVAAH